MIQIDLSAEEISRIERLRDHHHHPRVRKRMQVLWLKSQGLPHGEICRLTGICSNTLCADLRRYQSGGLAALTTTRFYRPASALEAHRDLLAATFRDHPPATLNAAAERIHTLTGLKRSPSAVRRFLMTLGMRPRKVGALPAKPDTELQEAFRIQQLEPRLAQAREGTRAVFFVDAAHFVFAPFLGVLWSFTRLFVRAPAGRQRFNVLGALHAITHELTVITNETYINAESVCALLRAIAALQLTVPITLVMDNAKYQKCALVAALASQLQIELLFLPAYSPNLNLIERLWKFVKKQVLYSKSYPDFRHFKRAISDCLSQTHTIHKPKLDSLLTLNFQVFKKCQLVPA